MKFRYLKKIIIIIIIMIIAFVKERFHNAVEITFLEFLRGIHRYKFGPPKIIFRGEIIQGE